MPLYIHTLSPEYYSDRPYYINEGGLPTPDLVTKVVADGKELQYIFDFFMSIPRHTSKKTQTWYGDVAKFIVAHLW